MIYTIFGHTFIELPNNSTIVDIGSGGDGFCKIISELHRNDGSKIYAVDIRGWWGFEQEWKDGTYGNIQMFNYKIDSLEEFFDRAGLEKIDLLKFDIEGNEVSIFENASPETLRKAKQITVEFHDFLFPEHKPRIKAIMRKMKQIGFYCFKLSFRGHGDVLFVRNDHASFLQRLGIRAWKYVRKLV